MQQLLVITHQHTILQEAERTGHILNRPTLKHVMFLGKYKQKQFLCEYRILTKGVFVTQLSTNIGNICLTNCVGYDKLLFHE